mgnify:CR=1 FL=1
MGPGVHMLPERICSRGAFDVAEEDIVPGGFGATPFVHEGVEGRQRLVPAHEGVALRSENLDDPWRWEPLDDGTGWRSWGPPGRERRWGLRAQARHGSPSGVACWWLEEERDDEGATLRWTYAPRGGLTPLWTGLVYARESGRPRHMQVLWEPREDSVVLWTQGERWVWDQRVRALVVGVETSAGLQELERWEVGYEDGATRLASLQRRGALGSVEPPQRWSWERRDPPESGATVSAPPWVEPHVRVVPLGAGEALDVMVPQGGGALRRWRWTGAGMEEHALPGWLRDQMRRPHRFVDVDGDGVVDLVVQEGVGWTLYLGPLDRPAPPEAHLVEGESLPRLSDAGMMFADVTGNGYPDLLTRQGGRWRWAPGRPEGADHGSVPFPVLPRWSRWRDITVHAVGAAGVEPLRWPDALSVLRWEVGGPQALARVSTALPTPFLEVAQWESELEGFALRRVPLPSALVGAPAARMWFLDATLEGGVRLLAERGGRVLSWRWGGAGWEALGGGPLVEATPLPLASVASALVEHPNGALYWVGRGGSQRWSSVRLREVERGGPWVVAGRVDAHGRRVDLEWSDAERGEDGEAPPAPRFVSGVRWSGLGVTPLRRRYAFHAPFRLGLQRGYRAGRMEEDSGAAGTVVAWERRAPARLCGALLSPPDWEGWRTRDASVWEREEVLRYDAFGQDACAWRRSGRRILLRGPAPPWEGGGALRVERSAEHRWHWSEEGVLLREVSKGWVGEAGVPLDAAQVRETHWTWSWAGTVPVPTSTRVLSGEGVLLEARRWWYDGPPGHSLPWGRAERGRVTAQAGGDWTRGEEALVERRGLGRWGFALWVEDGAGVRTQRVADETLGAFEVVRTQGQGRQRWSLHTRWHLEWGIPLHREGLVEEAWSQSLDDLGRVVERRALADGGSVERWRYGTDERGVWVEHASLEESERWAHARLEWDAGGALRRHVRLPGRGEDPRLLLLADVERDALGRVVRLCEGALVETLDAPAPRESCRYQAYDPWGALTRSWDAAGRGWGQAMGPGWAMRWSLEGPGDAGQVPHARAEGWSLDAWGQEGDRYRRYEGEGGAGWERRRVVRDALGRVVAAEMPPLAQETGDALRWRRWSYDSRGRVRRAEVGGLPPVVWTYDPAGRRVGEARGGEERRWRYDDHGRLVLAEARTEGGVWEVLLALRYGEGTLAGKVIERREGDQRQTFAYDTFGHLRSRRVEVDGYHAVVGLVWRPDGTLAARMHPDGRRTALHYDAWGRLEGQGDDLWHQRYDTVGRRSQEWGRGLGSVVWRYDESGSPVAWRWHQDALRTWSWEETRDGVGRPRWRRWSPPDAPVMEEQFSWDGQDRLRAWRRGPEEWRWSYDSWGRLVSEESAGRRRRGLYGEEDRVPRRWGDDVVAWDAMGRLVQHGAWRATWSWGSQPDEVEAAGVGRTMWTWGAGGELLRAREVDGRGQVVRDALHFDALHTWERTLEGSFLVKRVVRGGEVIAEVRSPWRPRSHPERGPTPAGWWVLPWLVAVRGCRRPVVRRVGVLLLCAPLACAGWQDQDRWGPEEVSWVVRTPCDGWAMRWTPSRTLAEAQVRAPHGAVLEGAVALGSALAWDGAHSDGIAGWRSARHRAYVPGLMHWASPDPALWEPLWLSWQDQQPWQRVGGRWGWEGDESGLFGLVTFLSATSAWSPEEVGRLLAGQMNAEEGRRTGFRAEAVGEALPIARRVVEELVSAATLPPAHPYGLWQLGHQAAEVLTRGATLHQRVAAWEAEALTLLAFGDAGWSARLPGAPAGYGGEARSAWARAASSTLARVTHWISDASRNGGGFQDAVVSRGSWTRHAGYHAMVLRHHVPGWDVAERRRFVQAYYEGRAQVALENRILFVVDARTGIQRALSERDTAHLLPR